VALGAKRLTHDARKLTGDQHPHVATASRSAFLVSSLISTSESLAAVCHSEVRAPSDTPRPRTPRVPAAHLEPVHRASGRDELTCRPQAGHIAHRCLRRPPRAARGGLGQS